VRPRRLSGVVVRPLNFTVRRTMEAPVRIVLLSAMAPAAAIVVAALAQLGLTTIWPREQAVTIGHVSVDSYVAVAAMLLLSFVVGWSLRRRTPTRIALWASFLVPFGWLAALLAAPHAQFGRDTMTGVFLAGATSPLLGVVLGWVVAESRSGHGGPSNNRSRGP